MKNVMLVFSVLFSLASNTVYSAEELSVRTSETLVEATEVHYWDKAKTYDGYTLFASRGKTYLIDMEGRVVHTWNIGTNPRFLDDNGHLLDATKDDPSGFQGFRELDWDGNTVWEYVERRADYAPHHDWVRIFNKKLNAYTMLYIANKSISHDEAIAAGCDPANGPYDGAQMDAIVEVDMDGNVVWEWWFFDHVVQDIDATKANYVGEGKTIADFPGRIDLNLPGRPVKRDWLHCNSLDYNAKLGQIVTNSVQGEFYVIDHDNTFIPGDPEGSIALAAGPAGDFLYRFGDPARYAQGDPPALLEDWTSATSGQKQLGGSHDIHWIKPGLPGAGHFLVFNNGQYLLERTAQSYIFEINGFLDGNGTDIGNYVNPPDAGYYIWELPKDTHKPKKQMSNQIVWIYYSKSNQGFFSHIGSGAQRLPNGNTLICSMTEGHIFEVTSDHEVVWEYINPVTNDGIVEVKPDSYPMSNAAFRAYRYGADHPALVNQDLTPSITITGKTPSYLTPDGTATGTDSVIPAGNTPPVITQTKHTPNAPAANDPVWVTTMVKDDTGVSGVTLTYGDGSVGSGGGEQIVFRETMARTAVKPWTGDGCDNAWTVTLNGAGNVEQRTQANQGEGNPCGVEFGTGTNDEADTMIETAQGIDARGVSGLVTFWAWADGLEGTDGWTFQLDAGSGYVTRLSELNGSNHEWQEYRYDLQADERVNGLRLRFQFRGGDQGDRVRFDDISVNVAADGNAPSATTASMLDDGLHRDGNAGDGVYGAEIPAFAPGTTVRYYITATDGQNARTTDPLRAPTATHSYTVQTGNTGTSEWSMRKLPDTGQTGDHTASHGEDSDYAIQVPSYTDNGDGTVTDNVTGLMWQQTDGGEMTWEQAQIYAEGLSLGGYDDWRLPSSHELFSLVDLGRLNPAINTEYFSNSGAEYWWTANARADDPSRIWAANAGGGIGAHPKSETLSAGGSKRFHAWCVRGAALPSGAGDYFVDNGDQTVLDRRTGLMWQQQEAGTMTWEDALVYAENLSLGGYDDWRLPNVKELRSITDDGFIRPSVDKTYFPNTNASRYWSSTTLEQHPEGAWFVNFDYGLVSYDDKTKTWSVRCVRGGLGSGVQVQAPKYALIPAGTFEMGDHHDLGGLEHGSDEIPIHSVSVDSFYMGTTEVTVRQYCEYLNAALSQNSIEIRDGIVYGTGGSDIYFETRTSSPYSRIGWDGTAFTVLDNKDNHPATDIRWHGAAAYCNWLSVQNGLEACYDASTWICDFSKKGFRLPTEAEWEFAARGGQYDPYTIFPWGDDENKDGTFANWPRSGDPYETGDYPWTTPVGFYSGALHQKADFDWPGSQDSYQTSDGSNAYGLYDMSGNVWEWCNDWYNNRYYGSSPSDNPTGADVATPMPDGKSYHVLRSGNWFNGEQYWGHARIANRNPAYYRGPDDPNHAWYHIGFRVVRSAGGGKTVAATSGVVAPGASVEKLAGGFAFTEGPAVDKDGNVYFTDIPNNRIHIWSVDGKLSIFRENSGGANGLFFDPTGNLLACEGDNGRVVSIDPQGNVSVLADQYESKRFNKPNDLWVDAKVGVYFSDPIYGQADNVQGGEHVYYLKPKRDNIRRVVDDMVRPNGLIGSPDGKTLYVADHGAGKTYRYDIDERGDLENKTLFAARGSDGMTIDSNGNVYLTDNEVVVFDSSGKLIETIAVPERPTNVCFGGRDRRTLFITAQTSLYSIRMAVEGVRQPSQSGNQRPPNSGGGNNPPPSGGQTSGSLNRDIGLIVNEPGAYEGYTLFAPKHYTMTYLMDNAGRIINSWESRYEPGQSVHLLPNGHLLHTCFIKTSASIGGGEGGRLEEYDWEGNLVWEFDYYTRDYAMHHDIEPLPNGNIIALVVERKTEQECIAAGFRREALRDNMVFPEYVIEIEPTYPKGGRIVWQWHVWDHLIQDNDPSKANYGVVADHPERISVEVNGGSNAVAFWNHMNSIDYNSERDQIMLSVRGCSELWVIDHSTSTDEAAGSTGGRAGKGGDLIYRWGNPAAYGAGNGSDQTLFQQHDTQWIEPGLPGEGNILVFNNGLRRLPPGVSRSQDLPPYDVGKDWGYSSVDELVPPVDANGNYTLASGKAYGPDDIAWTYVADPPVSMFAEAISGAQRLPNGNTLICDGTSGILFEVTPEGRTVWKYVCPVDGDGPMKQGDSIPLDERAHAMNAIFKVHRYAPDYPGLAGRDLTPGPPLVSNVQSLGSQKTGDLDGDGMVNFTDFLQFAQQFGKKRSEAGFNSKCDLDGNGEVGFEDFLQFARGFGTSSVGAAKPAGQNSDVQGLQETEF